METKLRKTLTYREKVDYLTNVRSRENLKNFYINFQKTYGH